MVGGVLVWLTSRYVRLTHEIATSSLEQVKQIKEAARIVQQQNARAFEVLALRIRVGLGQLNWDAPEHKQLWAFSLLTERDIADAEALATQVGGTALNSANEAVASLRVVHGRLQTAKDINEGTGWIPTVERVRRWKKTIEASHWSLQEIEEACQHLVAA
jgi:hypothetical protein